MGFLNSLKPLFSGSDRSELWKVPQSESEIESVFSKDGGLHLIYKHSYACGVCRFSLMRIEKKLSNISEHAIPWFIDVRNQRKLSNKIAELSGVRHESPQLLLLLNGDVYWSGSHSEVDAAPILESLKELKLI